ncbi:MAG: respiratory nitrate reductase subunit beta [Planctomycetes bacterium]|nr:respiratory nitrate reductase subunit beta [Planctomycetota bacterium]
MSEFKGKQLAAVFDLNKCLECHTCTVACKMLWTNRSGREYMYWNNVETMPGFGYPKGWGSGTNQTADGQGQVLGGGFKEVKLEKTATDGKVASRGSVNKDERVPNLAEDYGLPWEYNYEAVMEEGASYDKEGATGPRPHWQGKEVRPKWGPNWEEDQGAGEWPNHWAFALPRICNHCTHPACLAACPRKAIYKRQEDGIVLVDQDRCRGYRECVRACPYKKTYFNTLTGKSEKCLLCYARVEKGVPPACFWQCPGRIRFLGWKDDKAGAVYKLVYEWKVALPLHPEFGTEPNVYYVPPIGSFKLGPQGEVTQERRIPIEYLGRLFGGVENVARVQKVLLAEREKMRQGQKSELCMILIGHDTQDRFQLDVDGRPFSRPEEVQPVKEQFLPPSEDPSKPYGGE